MSQKTWNGTGTVFSPYFWQCSLAGGCPSPTPAPHAGFDGIEVVGRSQNFKPRAPSGGTISHFESRETGEKNETLADFFTSKQISLNVSS